MTDKYKSFFSYSIDVLKKHLILVFSVTAIVLILVGVLTFGVMKPKYTSTTQLLVNQKLSKDQLAVQAQQTQSDIQRVYTYKDIITSPIIKKTVTKELKQEPGAKNAKLSVQSQQNSQVFSVSATTNNPYTSSDVANETAKVFQRKVKNMMDINSVTVVSKATPKMKPTSPQYVLNMVLGLVFGFILGISIAIFREANDKTVSDIDYLNTTLGLNNLGIITEIDEKDMDNNKRKHSSRSSEHRRRV